MPITRSQETKQVSTMAKKRGLYDNINARKRAGTSRPKSESTISSEAYAAMKDDFGRKKKMGGGAMMSPRKAMADGGYGSKPKKRMKKRYGGSADSGRMVSGPCS